MCRPEILKQVDSVDGQRRIITVCAWCLPGEKVFDFFPTLRGMVEINHGICASHREEFIAGLKALAGRVP